MNNLCTYNPGTGNCLPQGLSTAHIGPLTYKAQGLQPHIRPHLYKTHIRLLSVNQKGIPV